MTDQLVVHRLCRTRDT